MDAPLPPPPLAAVIKQLLASVQQANDANGQRRSQRAVITLIRPPSPRRRPDLIRRRAQGRGLTANGGGVALLASC